MIVSVREQAICGNTCVNARGWLQSVWDHLPVHLRRLADDVRVLFLSAPGPE